MTNSHTNNYVFTSLGSKHDFLMGRRSMLIFHHISFCTLNILVAAAACSFITGNILKHLALQKSFCQTERAVHLAYLHTCKADGWSTF